MEKLKLLITSRKFWAAMVGLILVVVKSFKPDFPLSEAEVSNLVYVLIAYILGTAIEDGAARINSSASVKGVDDGSKTP